MRENPEQSIDKKRAYFIQLGLSVREALMLHKKVGLWERKEGKRDWGNVSEHCLVEVARVDVLADKLNLPGDLKKDLRIAAALHDFFKKSQKEIVSLEGLSWDSFEKSSNEATTLMRKEGFSEKIIRLVNSTGHESLDEIEPIIKKVEPLPEEMARLILHYIDDYTVESEWSGPAQISPEGNVINDLDRRMDKNESNPRYARVNEEGRVHFNGETSYKAQRRIGHIIEEILARAIAQKTGDVVDPRNLPEFIDKEIQAKIAAL